MSLVAGVDSSTQSCKVVVRDVETGAVIRNGRASHPHGTEVDPAAWETALREAVAAAGGLDDVAAISVGGQQHGMVALDERGEVIRPALLWNDIRSAPATRQLIDEIGADEFVRRTGSVPVPSFTATKLRWLRENEPDNAARVAAVALPHDWLSWRLRGFGPDNPDLDALATDRSEASGTSYWSPVTGQYDRELLVTALGHDAILPTVLAPDAAAGVTAMPGIAPGITVAAGAGDNAAAALGLGLRPGTGDVVVSLGTSGTVFASTTEPVFDRTGTVAGFADAAGGFLPLLATLNAARVLDAIARLLDLGHGELGELALQAPPGADGLVLRPYFEGERSPNLPDATATLSGMTLASTTRANLARAAVEGMLCGLADGFDRLRDLGVPAHRVLLIGGAAQNPAVAHITAQVFDVPVAVPDPGEYVATGAALQAAWSLGERPTWRLNATAVEGAATEAVIRAQYRAA